MPRIITVAPLPPGLSVLETAAPAAPSAGMLQRIDAIWDEEQRRRGATMTNGRIFSLGRRDGAEFAVWETQYKWWIAQRRDPTLFQTLAVRPLAVTGIVRLAEGLVFARRAESNTQDAGLWELPPSGGIDDTCRRPGGVIAADAQITTELNEELSVLPSAMTAPPRAIAVMEDDADHVVDIVFALQVNLSARELVAKFAAMTNREYTALRVIEGRDAASVLAQEGGSLSPASAALLDYIGANL
jgi:hypothetical protein